jgi:hypothetical protein
MPFCAKRQWAVASEHGDCNGLVRLTPKALKGDEGLCKNSLS